MHEESKQKVPVRIIDNNDNTYAVEVIPPLPGTYSTNLLYGGLKVPMSPKVTVAPPVDVSKIKVDGLEPSKYCPVGFRTHVHMSISISIQSVSCTAEQPATVPRHHKWHREGRSGRHYHKPFGESGESARHTDCGRFSGELYPDPAG